jgi:hypothetical protein
LSAEWSASSTAYGTTTRRLPFRVCSSCCSSCSPCAVRCRSCQRRNRSECRSGLARRTLWLTAAWPLPAVAVVPSVGSGMGVYGPDDMTPDVRDQVPAEELAYLDARAHGSATIDGDHVPLKLQSSGDRRRCCRRGRLIGPLLRVSLRRPANMARVEMAQRCGPKASRARRRPAPPTRARRRSRRPGACRERGPSVCTP